MGPVDATEFNAVTHILAAKGYTLITEALYLAAASLPVGGHERNYAPWRLNWLPATLS